MGTDRWRCGGGGPGRRPRCGPRGPRGSAPSGQTGALEALLGGGWLGGRGHHPRSVLTVWSSLIQCDTSERWSVRSFVLLRVDYKINLWGNEERCLGICCSERRKNINKRREELRNDEISLKININLQRNGDDNGVTDHHHLAKSWGLGQPGPKRLRFTFSSCE